MVGQDLDLVPKGGLTEGILGWWSELEPKEEVWAGNTYCGAI